MASADNSRYLIEASHQRHEQTVARATEAIRLLERTGKPVTFASVADTAAVSRGWLYRVPERRAAIIARRPARPSPRARPVPTAQRASTESLQRRAEALREEIARLRAENAQLRDRVARLHGERRVGQLPPPLDRHPQRR
jgi:hypothetical protein